MDDLWQEFDFTPDINQGSGAAARGRKSGTKALVGNLPAEPRKSGRRAAPVRKIILCPFTVRCDTAEGLPYSFDGMVDFKTGKDIIVPTNRENIIWGDYAIDGLHTEAVIERKSLSDLYGTLTHGRARFENELAALNAPPYKFATVCVEATWEEVCDPTLQDPTWDNRTYPSSIVGTIHQWMVRYARVCWKYAGTRRGAEEWTFEMLQRYWKEIGGTAK